MHARNRFLQVRELLLDGQLADAVYTSDTSTIPTAHLFYTWQSHPETGHCYGHYNLLIPCKDGDTPDLWLPVDAPTAHAPIRAQLQHMFESLMVKSSVWKQHHIDERGDQFSWSWMDHALITTQAASNLAACVDSVLACSELGDSETCLGYIYIYIYIYTDTFIYIYIYIYTRV